MALFTIDAEARRTSRGDTFYYPGATEQEAEVKFRTEFPDFDIIDIRPSVCINGPETCEGDLDAYSFGRNGKAFPRCRKHAEERMETEERLNQDYPDSDMPPAWFDPAYAGEHWDSDY